MTTPIFDLDELKDDIGMPADTTNDAWLQRRIDGAWARIETYCNRHLGPVVEFRDTWQPVHPERNVGAYWPVNGGVAYYLRNYPVMDILAVFDGGQVQDADTVRYDPKSGLLIGYGQTGSLSAFILPAVSYMAGYEEIPPDLYECMVGILQTMWTSRANVQSGISTGGLMPSQIDIADVGSLTLGAGNASGFASALVGDAKYNDPLLGPYTYVLDHYRDRRAEIGSIIMPVTSMVTTTATTVPVEVVTP